MAATTMDTLGKEIVGSKISNENNGRSPTAIAVGAADGPTCQANPPNGSRTGRAASSTPPGEGEQEQGSPDLASGSTDDLSLGETAASAVAAVEVKEQPEREASPFSQCSSDGSCDLTVKPISKIRKTDKSIEHVLKALNSLQTTEEKLAALCKKYADLHEEHRILQTKFKQSQKKLAGMIREKDQLQTEHSKAILAKSKLESLCRELQRRNKLVKDESLARAKEEEEKRKEVTNKFQTTINDIQQQMNDHYAKNQKLREENVELANKLKSLIEQYELREKHIEKVFKHKDLEQQLVDAKLAQTSLQATEEKERNIKEKTLLLEEASEAQKKIKLLEAQEKQLRSQVALYTEKYEEFQTTLAKSNDVFSSFKTEMDKMTKKIKKLEKETTMWKSRWENSNKALLDMAEDKTRSDKEINTLTNKIKKLESLCRALQQQGRGVPRPQADTGRTNGVEGEAGGTKTPPNTPTETPSDSRASPETVTQQDQPQETEGGVTEQQDGATDPDESKEPSENSTQSEQVSQSKDAKEESGGAVNEATATSGKGD